MLFSYNDSYGDKDRVNEVALTIEGYVEGRKDLSFRMKDSGCADYVVVKG